MSHLLSGPRITAFVDGQNLFGNVKSAFGYSYANFDLRKLTAAVCLTHFGTNKIKDIYFYTGIPRNDKPDRHLRRFWMNKIRFMREKQAIHCFHSDLKYDDKNRPREKGIDVKLALDIFRLAYENQYDAAILFSQDNDFRVLVPELRNTAKLQKREIQIFCAYPLSSSGTHNKGIEGMQSIPFNKYVYDQTIDTNDYR